MRGSTALELIKATYQEWSEDEAPRLGASLAYYAVFSLAPLLIIVVAVVSFVYRGDTVGEIERQLSSLVGAEAAGTLAQAIHHSSRTGSGLIGTIIGIVALLFGATGVFTELQASMNKIWEVDPKVSSGWLALLKDRILSFGMVLSIALLLMISLALSAVISAASQYFSSLLPGTNFIWYFVDIGVSFAVITFVFALLFKYIPDVEIAWSDVWVGAGFTAVLFVIGKFLIGMYLGQTAVGSAFGAAGSFLVILAWVYYSSQILFFGAEFTQVYANRYGSRVIPEQRGREAA